jgi:hypothetical protein
VTDAGLDHCAISTYTAYYSSRLPVIPPPRDGAERANLTGADAAGANLSNAVMSRANLTTVNAFHATLDGAFMWGVNLTDTDLRWASLHGANLTKTMWDDVF